MAELTGIISNENCSNIKSLFCETLSTIGCCKICSLRFLGETKIESYMNVYNLSDICHGGQNGVKKLASNPCIACLGLLQPPICNKIIDEIIEAVDKEDYDNPTFNIAFSIPVSFYLRAHAILVFLLNNHPQHVKEHLPLGLVTVGVKDAWKYAFANKVADKIKKRFDVDSDLRIHIDIQYEDDHAEINCLLDMYPDKFKERRITGRRLRHCAGPTQIFSRKTVEALLEISKKEHFVKHYPVPPSIPSHAAFCNNVMFEQSPVYVGGRYNKFVRGLPQTAWLVNNERKLETSVHELIAAGVQELTKAQGSKLISSGREDVDVRMLGTGRPFALELTGPRHVVLTKRELQDLENRINKDGEGKIAVCRLSRVSKSHMEYLKLGEESKTKTYLAYCVAWSTDAAKVGELATDTPIVVQQKTPVRVLHRRPIATRPKTINWMKISNIQTVDDKIYFNLRLNTQAGTYIKEFVHGDFGRTIPSLGDLLGGVTADCLALDVESIELNWPIESTELKSLYLNKYFYI